MTILQFQKFYEFDIRVIEIDGQPWFVAKDLCTALGIRNSRQALKRLDKSEKMPLSYEKVRACSDDPDTTRFSVVSESGMYSLIFSSRKPAAKEYLDILTGLKPR
jgi:prophage antirepressor-like protein